MVFGFGKSAKHREIDAVALHAMILADKAVAVDVREADEFAAGHIPGAINMPLSAFDAAQITDPQGRLVV